jgi:hypothetical protein
MPLLKLQTRKIEVDRVMRITLKDLNTESMGITDKGIELEIREANGTHTGDLVITPTKIIWNKGKKSNTGKAVNWPRFFKMMQES